MSADDAIRALAAVDPVAAVSEQERLLAYRAAREREDGAMLRVQREKVTAAPTISDTRRRDRELLKIANAIRGYVWCRALSEAAIELARLIEDYCRYHDRDVRDALVVATRTAGPTLLGWAGK